MDVTQFKSLPTYVGSLLLCFLLAQAGHGQEKTIPLASEFPAWQVARWEGDAKALDLAQISEGGKEKWGIFSFNRDLPGQIAIEERATKNPKTGVWEIIPGTDTKPLLKGKYKSVVQLGVGLTNIAGSYRYEATPGLTGYMSGSTGYQNYLKGEPRFVGGYAIARLNSTQGATQFAPVFALPPQWVPYIKPVVQEYRNSGTSIKNKLEDTSWLLAHLKSPNPVWRVVSLRFLLQESKLDDAQLKAIHNQFIAEKGVEKAVFTSLLIDSDREKNRFHNFFSPEVSKHLNNLTPQDVSLLLNTLIASDMLWTNNPITGAEDSSFGSSLLRVLAVKVKATDDSVPLASENKSLLQSFVLGPHKVDFSPPAEAEAK